MSGERAAGTAGERLVEQLLKYEGCTIIERQPLRHGHRLDLHVRFPDGHEALVEVKVWADPKKVGTDNVKKALGVAANLMFSGEELPYILVLSHRLGGIHHEMFQRAIKAGTIAEVRVLGFLEDL